MTKRTPAHLSCGLAAVSREQRGRGARRRLPRCGRAATATLAASLMLGFTAFVWAAPVAAAPGSPSSVATASAAGAPTLPSSSPAASTASARTSVVSPSVAPSPAATASAPSASPSYSNSVGAQSSTPRLAQATGVTFPREGTSAAPVNGKTAAQQQAAVPLATDFAAHARRAAALDAPLIVLVSLRDCVYCGPIRQRELAPLVRSGKYEVREIGMDSTAGVRDFDGSTTTGIAWARAHGVKVSPTVLFLDTHGRPVADPLIGAGLPDFYGAYLDDAIARGRARLHAGSGATTR